MVNVLPAANQGSPKGTLAGPAGVLSAQSEKGMASYAVTAHGIVDETDVRVAGRHHFAFCPSRIRSLRFGQPEPGESTVGDIRGDKKRVLGDDRGAVN